MSEDQSRHGAIAPLERWPPDPIADSGRYASITAKRIVAYLIDLLVLMLIITTAAILFTIVGILTFGILSPLLALTMTLIPLAYHTLTIGGPRSATLGMRAMGIEVRRLDGGRPDYVLAAIQTVLFYVTVWATGSLILLVVFFNPRRRTLHDFLTGLIVVNSLGNHSQDGR